MKLLRPTLALHSVGWILVLLWYGTGIVDSLKEVTVYINPGKILSSADFTVVPGVKSNVDCASRCLMKQCHAYFYEGGKCTLTGELTAPSKGSKSAEFRKTRFSLSSTNIALNKPVVATPSTSLWSVDRDAYLSVDGDEGTILYYQSVTSTKNPWWIVDIGEPRLIGEIQVKFIGNGSDSTQFNNMEIRVGNEDVTDGNFDNWQLLAFFLGDPPNLTPDFQTFQASNIMCGRYVSIKKLSTTPKYCFSLNEVKVFAIDNGTVV